MAVIDVHTHALSDEYISLLGQYGSEDYHLEGIEAGRPIISMQGVSFRTNSKMFDYEARLRDMDDEGIDMSVLSLTTPNVYWGSQEGSVAAARTMNDSMADAQSRHPERFRFLASLPWEYADEATAELERARGLGAVGVVVLGHIRGKELVDPLFDPVWTAIDRHRMAVQVHPNVPANVRSVNLPGILQATFGFTFDTSVAFSKMVMSGFFDRYPNIKLLALHGGGMIPYQASRMDMFYDRLAPERRTLRDKPSGYLKRLYFDAAVYDNDALDLLIRFAGAERVLFGTDYPHPTDVAGILQRIDECRCEPKQRDLIRGNTARELFGL